MFRTVALETLRPSGPRALWDPTGVAVATYSSMTARRINSEAISEPMERGRRATVSASGDASSGARVGIGELALAVGEC